MAKSAKSKTPSPLPFDQQVALRLQELSPSKDAIQHSEDAITPSVDVIHGSGDVIDVSEDVSTSLEGEQGVNDSDCTKMVATQSPKKDGVWHENPYLPTQPHLLGTKEQDARFLEVLREKKYICWAAPEFGCSRWTVDRRMLENPEFASAVYDVITKREEMVLAKIEAFSEEMALTNSKVTDRAMQLNALGYGKYKRDAKGVAVNTQVNIMIGFTPPKHRGT